jgi:TonB family protein
VTSAVEVLYKPQPAYTEAARQNKIEGAVTLEVLFAAAGDVRILRLLQGLGDGLDENAMRAARQIRFRPAERDGEAVDSVATVQIRFQLAY